MKRIRAINEQLQQLDQNRFTRRWVGLATLKQPYAQGLWSEVDSLFQYVQRTGERPEAYDFNAFLSTKNGDETETLTLDYPKRWHIEEFFNAHQALGWNRGGTQNLNVRYGQMTMALLAQAALHKLRQRLGEPYRGWEASHLAQALLSGLEGDIRVRGDTILVTYYNAPQADRLTKIYQNLPARLEQEGVAPGIPWLYGFKLDFCFR